MEALTQPDDERNPHLLVTIDGDTGQMIPLVGDYAEYDPRNYVNRLAMPDASQCPLCGYFDLEYPGVKDRLKPRRDLAPNPYHFAKCKCESIEDRQKSADESRYSQALLPNSVGGAVPNTMETFNLVEGTPPMREACDKILLPGNNLLTLVGQSGSGKSHLLEATCRRALDNGYTARYEMASGWLDGLRETYDDSEEEGFQARWRWYERIYLLALDDVGLGPSSDWAQEKITRLVEERLNFSRKLLISTNMTRDHMAEKWGERLASRIFTANPEITSTNVVISSAGNYRDRVLPTR